MGVKFIGEKGDWLWCTRGAAKVTASDPTPKMRPGQLGPIAASNPKLLPKLAPNANSMRVHVTNWLNAIRINDATATATTAEIAHRSSCVCCLGQMCMELGRGKKSFSLNSDSKKESTGNAEYDKLMTPFARDKYDLKINLGEFGIKYDDMVKI
jgi:hypothetical protein